MPIKSIISFARNAVTKYKARRVKSVVDSYIGLADAQVVMIVPAVMEFYRRTAHTVVDKTFENPEPALKLVDALDAVSKHYGPTLRAEFEAFSAKLEERGADPAILQRVEALFDAFSALTTDVNDH